MLHPALVSVAILLSRLVVFSGALALVAAFLRRGRLRSLDTEGDDRPS